ncbi:S-layer homology domain-containing protein [Leucobacter soli]
MLLSTLTACSTQEDATASPAPSAVTEPAEQPAQSLDTAQPAVDDGATAEAAADAAVASPTVEVVDEVEPVEVPEELEAAPVSVPVNGSLMVIHAESAAMIADETPGDEGDVDHDHADGTADDGAVEGDAASGDEAVRSDNVDPAAGGVWLTTEDGDMLPVDEGSFDGEIATGQEFAGEIVLSDAVQQTVQDRIDVAGPIPTAEAVAAAGAATQRVTLSGTVSAPLAAVKAPSKKTHKVYIFNFKNPIGTGFTSATVKKIATDTGTYWKKQTGGKFKGLSIKGYKSSSSYRDYCNMPALWKYAAKKFGKTVSYFEKSYRHLLVFVEQGNCGPAGLASIGATFHQGGTIWTDLAYADPVTSANMGLDITAHEMGHNLGLGHAQSRTCGNVNSLSGRIDTGHKWTWDGYPYQVKRPFSTCTDNEYNDRWSVMGDAFTAKPPALNIAQKYELGVANSSIKSVSSKKGAVQDLWIYAASADSGRRGLKVNGGKSGTIFVEYRTGTGQDSGIGGAISAWQGSAPAEGQITTGVRVLKSYAKGRYKWNGKWHTYRNIRSSVLAPRTTYTYYGNPTNGQAQGMAAGQKMYPYQNGVRITVLETNSTKAKVRVEFRKGFKNGGKSVTASVSGGGDPIAGKTLKVKTSGSWKTTFGGTPKKITQKYQWYRNGKAIKKATKSSYKTTRSDIGKQISVKVRPSAKGYITGKGSVSAKVNVQSPPYKDVLYGADGYTEIAFMKEQGIINGSTFSPKGTVTHDLLARLMWNANPPASYTPPSKSPFADVKTSRSGYKQIAYAYENGFITGTKKKGKRYFAPTKAATRGEIARAIFVLTGHDSSYPALSKSPYADLKKSSSFNFKAVSWMYNERVYTGAKKGGKRYFKSSSKVNRTVMAKFLYRAYYAS